MVSLRKRYRSKADLAPVWWRRVDSNHRSETQQIYSLPPLATRELLRMRLSRERRLRRLELVDGFEPPTC